MTVQEPINQVASATSNMNKRQRNRLRFAETRQIQTIPNRDDLAQQAPQVWYSRQDMISMTRAAQSAALLLEYNPELAQGKISKRGLEGLLSEGVQTRRRAIRETRRVVLQDYDSEEERARAYTQVATRSKLTALMVGVADERYVKNQRQQEQQKRPQEKFATETHKSKDHSVLVPHTKLGRRPPRPVRLPSMATTTSRHYHIVYSMAA